MSFVTSDSAIMAKGVAARFAQVFPVAFPVTVLRARRLRAKGLRTAGAAAALAFLTACAGPSLDREEEGPQAAEGEIVYSAVPGPPFDEPLPLPQREDPDDGRLKAALLLPLSGEYADLGENLRRAAEIALFDVADEDFGLLVRDTAGTPAGAERAAEEAIADGAEIILGPLFAAAVEAVAPLARAEDLPVLALTNNRSVAGEDVYTLGLLPSEQVDRVVGYAASQGHLRFAVLAPDNAYGDTVRSATRAAIDRYNVEMTSAVSYPAGIEDASDVVRRLANYDQRAAALRQRRAELQASSDSGAAAALRRLAGRDTLGPPPFDAIVLPEGGNRLRAIAPLLPFYDVDPDEVRFLGSAQWEDPSLGREPALVGGWFAAPQPEGWEDFARRFEEIYGTRPPRLASLAYDATALAALLARTREDLPEEEVYASERLNQRSGFAGVDGVFRLNGDGGVERRYAVFEIREDGLAVIDPAPTDFRELLN